MIIDNYYSEEQKEKIKLANKEYIDSLRLAISNKKIDEFFNGFGFKPRFLEIVEILLCFSDGKEMILDLYEYIIKNIRDIHIPALVQKLVSINQFNQFIIKDFDYLYERSLDSSNILTNNIINFALSIIQMPNGDCLIIPKLNEILKTINPTLVSSMIKQFEGKTYFQKLIEDNFEEWATIARGEAIIYLIKILLATNRVQATEYIRNNFDTILKSAGGGNIYDILTIFSSYEELIDIMQQNVKLIIDYSSASDINNILNNLDEKLCFGLLNSNDILISLRKRLSDEKQNHLVIGAIIKSGENEYLKSLLNNMLNQEQVSDFVSIGDNSWSNLVFKIGNKVLKLGWIRNNPNCDQHYRLIKPERYDIIYDKDNNPILYIEIQKFLSQDNINEDDIEEFYKDLNEDGYIYIDPRGKNPTNFGVLNYEDASKSLYSQPVSKTFKNKPLVLIDRDCVWRKDDPNIKYMGRY